MDSFIYHLIVKYPELRDQEKPIWNAFNLLQTTMHAGGTIFTAGNGGSYTDAEHIVGELRKSFVLKRPIPAAFSEDIKKIDPIYGTILAQSLQEPIRASSLPSEGALTTAFINDVNAETLIAQEFYGLADMYDCLFLISTSGNSRNLQYAAIVAKAKHIPVILLTGPNKGSIEKYADVVIRGKGRTTAEIQDQHTPIYHCLCQMLEDEKFAQMQPASVSEHWKEEMAQREGKC